MEAACCFTRYRKREHSTSSRKFNCNKSEQFFGVNGVERLCAFLASFEIRYHWNFDTRSFFFWMFSRYFLLSIPYFIRLFDNCILQIVGFSYWLAAPSYAFSRSLRLAQKSLYHTTRKYCSCKHDSLSHRISSPSHKQLTLHDHAKIDSLNHRTSS